MIAGGKELAAAILEALRTQPLQLCELEERIDASQWGLPAGAVRAELNELRREKAVRACYSSRVEFALTGYGYSLVYSPDQMRLV